MKLNLLSTYHHILLVGLALLLTPAKIERPCAIIKEVKIEHKQTVITNEETAEVLHGEMLFRF
jgi:hypothetical protein